MAEDKDRVSDVIQEEEHDVISDETRKKADRYFFRKIALNALFVLLGAVLIAAGLRHLQHHTALIKQNSNSNFALDETISILESNEEEAESLTTIFHDGNQDMLEDLQLLISGGHLDSYDEKDSEELSDDVYDMVGRSGVDYLFILSGKGRILLSSMYENDISDPVSAGIFSEKNYGLITEGTLNDKGIVVPVYEKNELGEHYFYSMPVTYRGKDCVLVTGVDASLLDSQLGSLEDVSAALKRAAVENDGFIFAVDRDKQSFRYYQNGGVNLSGHNVYSTGLSEKIMTDGYAGTETINGSRYYCVSKACGDDLILCAAAPIDEIFRYDSYVLFWSVTVFLIVMLLCLAYAVIVRNDFVRNAVETKKMTFRSNSSNPLILDISVFNKVAPLMAAGILVIFGISLYAQTLLEISQSVEKSETAIESASAGYDESRKTREITSYYYNTRFSSKAGMIAYLIEEKPDALNEETDRYYTEYNDKGNKVYIKDSEGNRLRSVSESMGLRELCNINNVDAIYVFDEEGHTIATNTPDWYYTVSNDPEEESYEFRDVLDGKTDVLVQTSGENEQGDIGQRIAVEFNYYTRTDDNGGTEYVSENEYEEDPDEVTHHRSMLQIRLNKSLSERIMESTDFKSVLSGTVMSSGSILLFDTSDDHKCIYSPKESSIGKTADELGISPKAFKGNDYYGFGWINGVNYFQYFRYTDGYYIATATPRNMMYHYRTILSLITALVSLIVILILLGTVTLTTKEEELLYNNMSREKAADGINSAIFSIILPSGRRASTTKAAARWDNRRIPWHVRTPEQKLLIMVSSAVGLLMLMALFTLGRANSFYNESSNVNYLLSGNWDRGWNIFAVTACILVVIITAIAVALFRIPVRLITALLGTRGETIGHLLLSVVRYGGAIGVFFYGLYLLGIDSTSLLASAGILSLVIGLGAQSLIKDIIAGIFIVFEGEFRVGDIVTINDYRGTVMDIGLRTTKIMGTDGNIKIYNNSDISGVLNMTQEASYASATIDIEYGQDIDYVEAVLERELPSLKENNRKILDGPTYLGVKALGESGVTILIVCKCSEADIMSVTRYLNKGVLKIFYRNNINVPFPHVTFSQASPEDRRTIDDLIKEKLESMEENEDRVQRQEPEKD